MEEPIGINEGEGRTMTPDLELDFAPDPAPEPDNFDPEAFAAARATKLADQAKPKRKRKPKAEKAAEKEPVRERVHLPPWVPPPRRPADVVQLTSKAPPGVPTWASARDYVEGAREYEAASLAQLELDDDGAATLASWNGTIFAAHRLAEAAQSAAVSRAYWCDAAAQAVGLLLAAPPEERWPCWSCEDNPHPDDPPCEDCGGVGRVTRPQMEAHVMRQGLADVERQARAARACEALASIAEGVAKGVGARLFAHETSKARVHWLCAVVALLETCDPPPIEQDWGPPPF